jgi:MobA/VirD2-like, nuclease domain/TraI-like middle domain
MIASAGTGSGFSGLARYLLHGKDGQDPDRVEWVSLRNLATDDPELVAAEMRATAAQAPRVEKPVYHLSISAPREETLSREQWEEVADRVLKDLGLEEHQVMLVAHQDREHEHVHLVVNRVHPERLRAWDNSHDYRRIERSLRRIERERGLREVPGHHYRLPGQAPPGRSEGWTSGERRLAERTGREPWIEELRREVSGEFRAAGSWAELEHRLDQRGLRIEARGRGLVVTDGERQVKASRIARSASREKLERRFGQGFAEWREARREFLDAVEAYQATAARREELGRARIAAGQDGALEREAVTRFQRLQGDSRAALYQLDRHLERVYRPGDQARARRDLLRLAHRSGWESVARTLESRPERFGRLQGAAVGRIESGPRRAARAVAREAAAAARSLGSLRDNLRRARGPTIAAVGRLLEARSRGRRAAGELGALPRSRPLEQQIARLAGRIGYEAVRFILAPSPLRAVRAVLRTVQAAHDLVRGAER